MAKTTFLNNYAGLLFGYSADTTVTSAEYIFDTADPPNIIGTKVFVPSLAGIGFSTLLEITGVGQVTVTGTGTTPGPWFSYSLAALPEIGASVRTPWNPSGSLLVTRADNSVTLNYYLPATHDLYFRTQKSADSGSIGVTLDGAPLGAFSLASGTTVAASVLLQSNVASGYHTITIRADLSGSAVFVYFAAFEMLEHDVETGGEYPFLGPAGTLDDSANNFIGAWSTVAGYAYTTDTSASMFFYPQLSSGGQARLRVQKTPDSAIVAVYVNGTFRDNLDLYADPAEPLFEFTLLDSSAGDAEGLYQIELRHTGTKNPSSTGLFFYFHSTVVTFSRSDSAALQLAADYLVQVASIREDGAFLDAWDSIRINFDANSLYGCMGLLAAYQVIGDAAYLTAVKKFLNWFAGMQMSAPGDPFTDGAWNIGYQVNLSGAPAYIPAIAPYDTQGISEIRWVDAVQCLPAFVLWWYWTLSGDDATRAALLPAFQRGIDGFIANNYDGASGFFFSSWQNKTAPTIFLYHDAIRRYDAGGGLIEQHDDAEDFFTYSGAWSSYAPQGAIGDSEHFTLASGSYVQFSFPLSGGEQIRWVTQSAWDTGIASILVSTDGVTFSETASVDTYSPALILQNEFPIFSAPGSGAYWFRIQHSGSINPAGNTAPGWQRLQSRFSAGQSDILLGLTALWLMTRAPSYAALAARIVQRFPSNFWSTSDSRWLISLDSAAPGTPNDFWYPMTPGYTAFGQGQSRLFQPTTRLAQGLQALEPYLDAEGGLQPPGYLEPEFIFSAFYLLGENQLAAPTNPGAAALAKSFLKAGQYLMALGGRTVGGIVFSKRYQYLYTNISGFACMALAGIRNPFTEQLKLSQSRMVMPQ